MKDVVYTLDWDYNYSGDSGRDAFHLPFEKDKEFAADMISTREILVPDVIYLQANYKIISALDFPLTSLSSPIMSDRMLNLINSIQHVNQRHIPVKMIDDTFMGKLFDDEGQLLSYVPVNEGFKALQIMEYTDAFDYENSVYEDDFILPVGFIHKLVLKTPQNGFPPIFRIKQCASKIFISQQAYTLLHKNEVKGCVFENVEVL